MKIPLSNNTLINLQFSLNQLMFNSIEIINAPKILKKLLFNMIVFHVYMRKAGTNKYTENTASTNTT